MVQQAIPQLTAKVAAPPSGIGRFKTLCAALWVGVVPRLGLALLLLNLVVGGLAVGALHQSRLSYEKAAQSDAQNLGLLLANDIQATLLSIDLALQVSIMELVELQQRDPHQLRGLNQFIERQLFQQPALDGLRIADAQGLLTHGTRVVPSAGQSIGQRPYFVRLRDDPNAGMLLSEPVMGRISGKRIIALARAMRTLDGTFTGAVVGSIPIEYFTRALADLSLGKGANVTLFDDDMRIVTRYPDVANGASTVGTKLDSSALLDIMANKRQSATYQGRSSDEDVQRTYAYTKLKAGSLNLSVSVSSDDYLAAWRFEIVKVAAGLALFALLTFMLAWLILRAWKNQELVLAELHESHARLDAEKSFQQAMVSSSPAAIYTRDIHGLVTSWNKAAQDLLGWSAEEVIGHPLLTVPAHRVQESANLLKRVLRGETLQNMEVERQRRDGSLVQLYSSLTPMRAADGSITGYLTVATDISERKAAEQRVEFLAYRDVLTGLPNRLLMKDRYAQAVAAAERNGTKLALVFLDLDNFKLINDSLGHAVGDEMLKEMARRLTLCVRDADTVSRQGGDEFLILLPGLSEVEVISPLLDKISERLRAPMTSGEHQLTTSGSMGVAVFPDDGEDFDAVLKKADVAMYQAKSAGRNNYRFFDEQMNVDAMAHLDMKSDLQRALVRGEFELLYQPQVNLSNRAVVAVEALLRWHHPAHGLLTPARFMAVAEDSGLIVEIGAWVIHEACRQAAAWRAAGLARTVVAVNVSGVQFRRGNFDKTVTHALQITGLEPSLLELELTESVLLDNSERVLTSVQRLQELGVTLSVDDYGTGYSNLPHLKRFGVDKLKIDSSFIRNLSQDATDVAIPRAIIQLAHSMSLRVIAEGVEDDEMLQLLRTLGCDEAQGYCYAVPLTAQLVMDYLKTAQAPRALEEGGVVNASG